MKLKYGVFDRFISHLFVKGPVEDMYKKDLLICCEISEVTKLHGVISQKTVFNITKTVPSIL
jgi:hypothetical protein